MPLSAARAGDNHAAHSAGALPHCRAAPLGRRGWLGVAPPRRLTRTSMRDGVRATSRVQLVGVMCGVVLQRLLHSATKTKSVCQTSNQAKTTNCTAKVLLPLSLPMPGYRYAIDCEQSSPSSKSLP